MTNIKQALIIRQPHIGKILDGLKTWEMRSIKTEPRGKIALIQQGTKTVVGIAEFLECIGPLSDNERFASEKKHGLSAAHWSNPDFMKYRFAWVLSNVRRLKNPVPYKQTGPVQWITLDETEVKNVVAQLPKSR